MRLLAFLVPEPIPLALLLADEQAADLLSPEVMAVVGPLLGDPIAAGDGLVLVYRLVQAVARATCLQRQPPSGSRPPQPWSGRRSPPRRGRRA